MRYQRVTWHHQFEDEPSELYAEIGEDGYERRKVDAYADGRLDFADATRETGTTGLSDVPMSSLEDINAQAEFTGAAIEREEFEAIWQRATQRHDTK